MIFSFTEDATTEVILGVPHTDIFCFFPTSHSIHVPHSQWWKAIAASLRLKKEVLILEENLSEIHVNSNARWLVGDKFLWLPPRSLSVFLEATHQNSYSYLLVKATLISRN